MSVPEQPLGLADPPLEVGPVPVLALVLLAQALQLGRALPPGPVRGGLGLGGLTVAQRRGVALGRRLGQRRLPRLELRLRVVPRVLGLGQRLLERPGVRSREGLPLPVQPGQRFLQTGPVPAKRLHLDAKPHGRLGRGREGRQVVVMHRLRPAQRLAPRGGRVVQPGQPFR